MINKLTLQQPEKFLWGTADILRGNIDASEFKDHLVAVMFFKRMSNTFDEDQQKVIAYYIDKGKKQALELADDDTSFLLGGVRWSALKDLKYNISEELNRTLKAFWFPLIIILKTNSVIATCGSLCHRLQALKHPALK